MAEPITKTLGELCKELYVDVIRTGAVEGVVSYESDNRIDNSRDVYYVYQFGKSVAKEHARFDTPEKMHDEALNIAVENLEYTIKPHTVEKGQKSDSSQKVIIKKYKL